MAKARLKRIEISPETLIQVMANDTCWRVQAGVPKGAILKGFCIDPYCNILNMFISHDSFELVDIGVVVPVLETSFRKVQ